MPRSVLVAVVVVCVVAAANVRIVVVAALVDAVCRCGCLRIALEWRANINKCVQND